MQADVRDMSSVPESGRSPGGGHSIFAGRIPMDRGAWRLAVHRVARSWTWLKRLSTHTHMPMQETRVWSLVWEDPTCCGATKPVHHNYWACALEPGNCSYWAQVPQLLKPACPRACTLQQKKPPHWEACTTQLEKSLHNNQDPAQPKINEIIKNKFSPFKK